MMAVAALLFLLGVVTVIYPIRSIGLSRRSWGVLMIIGSMVLSVAAAPELKASKSANSASTVSHSGRCRTDASGTYRCDSETNFGVLGTSSSSMVCRKNPVTDQTDCKWETTTR
jgi:hypothetical protein